MPHYVRKVFKIVPYLSVCNDTIDMIEYFEIDISLSYYSTKSLSKFQVYIQTISIIECAGH